MLAGLAAQTLTVDTAQVTAAFLTTAIVFATLLVAASIMVSVVSVELLTPIRMTGHTVKRWSGYLLVVVGIWFVALAVLSDPILIA